MFTEGHVSLLSELGKRIAVGIIGIPLFCLIVLVGKIPFLLLVNIIMVISLWEFYTLAEKKGFFPLKIVGVITILLIAWGLYFRSGNILWWLLLVFFILMLIEMFKGKDHSLINISVTVLGILYISLFSSYILFREISMIVGGSYSVGGWLILLIFFTIWICDTGAYLMGSLIGKHKLYPRISPNKTWEGAISGFLIGIGSAIGLSKLFHLKLLLVDSFMIGFIVGTIGQLSDLTESMFKRDAGVKDSSSFLPGHGGILDRFDSPLFVGPVVYLYLMMRGFPS